MKGIIRILAVSLTAILSFPAVASMEQKAFTTCLIDSLNGRERKELATWVYFSIATHPELEPYSKISGSDRDKSDQKVGALVNRLLIKDCPNELSKANKSDPRALEKAFEMLGAVAMQELMNEEKVVTAVSNYSRYLDQEALLRVIE